jgi:predicted TPR repeat methyltransferase
MIDLLAVDPYHLDGLFKLGDLLGEAGRAEQAAVAYRRVLHFDPGHAQAKQALQKLQPVALHAAAR